jgi:RNA polymerase sigma-70 factor (ECF subfamily)
MNEAKAATADKFTAVYELHYGAIHAYAARRVGSELADEVAAETFTVAWRRLDTMPPEPLPWLYGIARNMVARQHTSASRRQRTVAALAHERWPTFQLPADSSDPALWTAWEQLRPADREVLALVAWEELPVSAAAQALGCSAPVFSLRLHRARRRLERLLAEAPAPHLPLNELSEAQGR